jgi:undecaprenyl-diphosphatase
MLTLQTILLAVIQGIAEFVPISSSGHIVVLARLFEQFGHSLGNDKLSINIVLHLGTLAAILVFYWRRILDLLKRDRRIIGLLVVGTIPAVVAGFGMKSQLDYVLESAFVAGICFPLTGLSLMLSQHIRRWQASRIGCSELTYRHAILIGLFQALAILPGISRSGATIVAGLACGLRRDEAATFSFLLAIPVIAGAGVLEGLDLIGGSYRETGHAELIILAFISFIVGLASLWWLVRWIQQGRLHLFAWYLFFLGPFILLWQLVAE